MQNGTCRARLEMAICTPLSEGLLSLHAKFHVWIPSTTPLLQPYCTIFAPQHPKSRISASLLPPYCPLPTSALASAIDRMSIDLIHTLVKGTVPIFTLFRPLQAPDRDIPVSNSISLYSSSGGIFLYICWQEHGRP